MKVTTSYAVEIQRANNIFKSTIQVFRDAISYLIGELETQWPALSRLPGEHKQFNWAESYVHTTKQHRAKCDFDQRFPQMPSYLRRAVIQSALGAVNSYHSNYNNWIAGGRKGCAPKLQRDRFAMPCFYRANMYRESADPTVVQLKLFHQNDWVWIPVHLLPTDVKYIQRHCAGKSVSAPTLERRGKKYFLRFAFEESVALSETLVKNQTVCAIDLGVNTDAVCSIMQADGTILARKFINFPSEKDHLCHVLNRIKKAQRKLGSKNASGFWRYARNVNKELSIKIGTAIVEFAVQQHCDVIVFEHLDFRGKKGRGNKRQRLHHWRKNFIQDIATQKAHQNGIRISHICAWGTSRLAFDGSGRVDRDEKNHALATFKDGKRYNCDLSASYNIGARYFIRELLKPLPVRVRSQVGAKVPGCERRTSCTYSTLLALAAALSEVVA